MRTSKRTAFRALQGVRFAWASSWSILAGRRSARRLLIVSDSRGLNLTRRTFLAYPELLACRYRSVRKVHESKWTTLADVHRFGHKMRFSEFDAVVVHVGISDFSPRPRTSARDQLYAAKQADYDSLFGKQAMARHLSCDLGVPYEGESTQNMFSLEMAEASLLPWLRSIPNLVFVTGSPVLSDWTGDYWKPRPANIGMANDYFRLLDRGLPGTISQMHWDRPAILRYTTDSIHLNAAGHRYLADQIRARCDTLFQ